MYVVLGAVDILGSKAPSISQAPGAFTLSANQLSRLPSVFAEPDPIRGLLLLPGVGGVLENNVGLAVRGGAVAQTLTTIDGATLWQSGHAAGFFSALHHQSIDQVTLYKEAPPGHLGGRASAYLDIGLREGNFAKYQGGLSLGLISSSAHMEGPLWKGRRPTSFNLVARSTYIDKAIRLATPATTAILVGFNDLQGKISSQLSPREKIGLSFYSSNDHYRMGILSLFNKSRHTTWHNKVASLVYDNGHGGAHRKAIMSYSAYGMADSLHIGTYTSKATEIQGKYLVTKEIDTWGKVEKGGQVRYVALAPGALDTSGASPYSPQAYGMDRHYMVECAAFVGTEWQKGTHWVLNAHLRTAIYLSSNLYARFSPEPRLRLTRNMPKGKLWAGYDRLSQFLRLYSAHITPMPNNVWYASTPAMGVMSGHSLGMGYQRVLGLRGIKLETSAYLRRFGRVAETRAGAPILITPDYEQALSIGHSYAYGLEIWLEKQKGKFTGWISYTYSRALLYVPHIVRRSNHYPAPYDKPHVLNVTMNRNLGKWELNAVFVLQSGRPITLPLYTVGDMSLYSERNEYRLPLYHRMDLSLSRQGKKHPHSQTTWSISVYNLYNRLNTYDIQLNILEGRVDYLTLFPILPFAAFSISIF
jgi:hypothetical protein